jgi:tetratricopeptide (TPR) repeat protein
MRILAFFVAAVSISTSTAFAESAAFEAAEKALTTKDYATALTQYETALRADPDNLRYASQYRQAVLQQAKTLHPKEGSPADFDRPIKFFETLVAEHPNAATAQLNYGFAYVDKMPASGAITQVIMANTALGFFAKSIEIKPTWLAYYTRGNSYLFWPRIFNRTKLGVADLEEAYKMQKAGPPKSYHLRVYISLGDGYWKTDELDKAKAMWKEGLAIFPNNAALKDRLAKDGDDLKTVIEDTLDPNKRVDTDLKELWSNP